MNLAAARPLGLAPLALVAGCVLRHPASAAFDGCWTDGAPTRYIVRTAANSIIGDQGAGGPRIRALAAVPLVVDSVRAHSRLVTDRAVCERFWRTLGRDERATRLAVVQIGQTYWARVRGGIRAFDDKARLLTAVVDL